MERKDFINAIDAVAKIREAITEDCASYTGFDPSQATTVRIELNTIDALEKARLALLELRDYLMLYPNEFCPIDAIIVCSYDGETGLNHFKAIANNEVLCSGEIEMTGRSREDNKVILEGSCHTEDKARTIKRTHSYSYDKYWQPNTFRKDLLCELIEGLFPNYDINITNIININ